MKRFSIFLLLVFTFQVHSSVALKINFKDHSKEEVNQFSQDIEAELNEISTFNLPNTTQEIEMKVSDRKTDKVAIALKIYETALGERKLISQSKILTSWGKEALLESFADDQKKQPLMTLKITPKKL
jgi:hypothetical protein